MDSVEKYLYRDGGGVTVEPKSFQYTWIFDDKGERASDHASAECVFEFTVTEDFAENTQELKVVTHTFLRNLINTMIWIVKDLVQVLSNVDQIAGLLG